MKNQVIGTDGAFSKPTKWQKSYTLSTAREWDTESSTYHYRSRSYNPSIGRFMRRDSIGYRGGLNLYSYIRNNPVDFIDPTGMCESICSECLPPCRYINGISCPSGYSIKGTAVDKYNYRVTCCCPGASLPGNPDLWGKEYNPTTSKLWWIKIINWYDSLVAWGIRDKASNIAENSGLPVSGRRLGCQDAYRHCVGSCMLAKEIGSSEAEKIGTAYENSNPGAFPEEGKMDLHNNARGRQIADAGLDCEKGCQSALTSGTLRVVRPTAYDSNGDPVGGELENSDQECGEQED